MRFERRKKLKFKVMLDEMSARYLLKQLINKLEKLNKNIERR